MMQWVPTFVSMAAALCAILFGYSAFMRNKKKDDETDGAKTAVMLSELGYIKAGLDEIKRAQKEQDEKSEQQHIEVIARLVKVEASAQQAHKRIDDYLCGGK